MPKFSYASLAKLSTCHPDLQMLFEEVIKYWDCTILEGYRTKEAQNAAFERGNSKLKYPHGMHNQNPSFAVDAAPYPLPDWKKPNDFIYFAGFVMGIAATLKQSGKMRHAIRYGADWNKNGKVSDERFLDCVHFEIIK